MINIRSYKSSDFDEIVSWWKAHDECPPLSGMMMADGTFVLELDGRSSLTLTCLKTQSFEISYLEGFCAMPGLEKDLRNDLSHILWDHCLNYLKQEGFKRVIALADKPLLVSRYEKLGMTKLLSGIHSLVKEF